MKSIHKNRYQNLINLLILHRKKAGLTQKEVAERLKKPQSFIAKVEGKDRRLDVLEFIEMCEVLKIKPSEFFHELDY